MPLYQDYAREIAETLDLLPKPEIHAMVQVLHQARLAKKNIFVIGNGGSASTASHLACDLNKNTVVAGCPRFKANSLTDNMALISALGNDLGYEYVFAEQLANLLGGDEIVIAISTSGNSPNILKAVELANQLGAFTIGWTGYTGGHLAKMVALSINIRNHCVEQIEDIHMILVHMLTVALRKATQTGGAMPVGEATQSDVIIPVLTEVPMLR